MSLAILLILELLQSFLTYSNLLQNYAQTYINITYQHSHLRSQRKPHRKPPQTRSTIKLNARCRRKYWNDHHKHLSISEATMVNRRVTWNQIETFSLNGSILGLSLRLIQRILQHTVACLLDKSQSSF